MVMSLRLSSDDNREHCRRRLRGVTLGRCRSQFAVWNEIDIWTNFRSKRDQDAVCGIEFDSRGRMKL